MKSVFNAAAIALLAAAPAHAMVVNGALTGGRTLEDGGVFELLDTSTAFSVGNNDFQSPNLFAFNENQNITIASTIGVDIGTSPMAGDVVASHYVFSDPLGTRSTQGYVDFDADIYGIATSTSLLAASDFLVAGNVTYQNPGLRGLEGGDNVAIDPGNLRRLLVDWSSGSPGDYVRVFTQESPGADPGDNPVTDPGADPGGSADPGVIPVPASLPLLVSALGLAALLRRRS